MLWDDEQTIGDATAMFFNNISITSALQPMSHMG
jgi:hypothetical protein